MSPTGRSQAVCHLARCTLLAYLNAQSTEYNALPCFVSLKWFLLRQLHDAWRWYTFKHDVNVVCTHTRNTGWVCISVRTQLVLTLGSQDAENARL